MCWFLVLDFAYIPLPWATQDAFHPLFPWPFPLVSRHRKGSSFLSTTELFGATWMLKGIYNMVL